MKKVFQGGFYPLSVFATAVAVYLLVTHTYDWKLWLALAVIAVERMLVQIGIWFFKKTTEQMMQRITEQIEKAFTGGQIG